MKIVGGLGFSNCEYGFGLGNAGGYGAAGYGGVFMVAKVADAPELELEPAPELGLELALEIVA